MPFYLYSVRVTNLSGRTHTFLYLTQCYAKCFLLFVFGLDSRDDFEKSCVICGKKKNKHFDLDDRQ